jgi:signal transduction histidine kinase
VVALAWFTGQTVIRPTRQLALWPAGWRAARSAPSSRSTRPLMREARQLSDSIVTLARTLEARADYVRELALGISHEFKTPLTGIRGSAELLRDHLSEMSAEERDRFLSNILADTARLERLVNRILELARADAVTPQGDERCDLAQASTEVGGRGAQGRAARVGRRHAVPSARHIDRASFDIVLANLLDNARQHAGAGAHVAISGHAEGDDVVVEVTDDGAGVSSAMRERIFDRFFTTARDAAAPPRPRHRPAPRTRLRRRSHPRRCRARGGIPHKAGKPRASCKNDGMTLASCSPERPRGHSYDAGNVVLLVPAEPYAFELKPANARC